MLLIIGLSIDSPLRSQDKIEGLSDKLWKDWTGPEEKLRALLFTGKKNIMHTLNVFPNVLRLKLIYENVS